jgi:hypothetical protein
MRNSTECAMDAASDRMESCFEGLDEVDKGPRISKPQQAMVETAMSASYP